MTAPAQTPLEEALAALLADGRPRAFDGLLDALASHLPNDEHDALHVLAEAIDRPRFATLDDEYWVDVLALADGRWFSHTLSTDEIDAGIVAIAPDLVLPLMAFTTAVPFDGGRTGSVVFASQVDVPEALADLIEDGGLRGPDGWLASSAPGDRVALGVRGGVLTLGPADSRVDASEAIGGFHAAYAALAGDGTGCTDLIAPQIQWLLDAPGALRAPTAPIGDIVASAGLMIRDGWVGPADGQWQSPPEREAVERRAFNDDVFAFSECCHDALDLVDGAFARPGERFDERAVAEALAHGHVAEAFAADLLRSGGHREYAQDVLAFCDEIARGSRDPELAGVRYVQAVAFDCLGDAAAAEDALRAVLRADPQSDAANDLMAEYVDVRGDAGRALEHLRRAGYGDDDAHVRRLSAIAAAAAPRVGRNDPCPCGSGRKFKSCCIDTPGLPAAVHQRWMYDKALVYAGGPARRGAVTHLAAHAVHAAGAGSAADRAVGDRRLVELALFEDGLLEEFIAERGGLLPAGEETVMSGWSTEPLGVFRVVSSGTDGVEIEDALTGERVAARGEIDAAPGDLVTARLLTYDDAEWIAGPVMPVPEAFAESALALAATTDVAACDWAEWLGYTESGDPDAPQRALAGGGAHGSGHHHHHH